MAEDKIKRKLQVVYARKMHERKVFMEELHERRYETYTTVYKKLKALPGPSWYQVLSVRHRKALDTLSECIRLDKIEGRPARTMRILRTIGLYPVPHRIDVFNCMYLGREDPKQFFAELFLTLYEYPVSARLPSYDFNMRTILSSIFYLGLRLLIMQLTEQFKPDKPRPRTPPPPKPVKPPPLISPYLEIMIAHLYEPKVKKRRPPDPLPDLGFLNKPYEEEKPILKPPPPPPPPPPPKDRLPRSYCDKLAGIISIEPRHVHKQSIAPILKRQSSRHKLRRSKMNLSTEGKKVYGIGLGSRPTKKKKKMKIPNTGLANAQYLILGVYVRDEKSYFILGSVTILPASGDLIHGGHARLPNGEYTVIHKGYRGFPPEAAPDPCSCLETWTEATIKHVDNSKCHCGHRYDYGNEGVYPEEEPKFFEKPTMWGGLGFNYNFIFENDPRLATVQREIDKVWDEDSMLHVEGDPEDVQAMRKKKKRALKLIKTSSSTCLGKYPKIEDYLRCALRRLRLENTAARLPDVQRTQELKEFMRRRLYGPTTPAKKKEMLKTTEDYFVYLKAFEKMGLGRVQAPYMAMFSQKVTWGEQPLLHKEFKAYIQKMKVRLFKAQAKVNNLLWASMFQPRFPDKKFREIYFSYMADRVSAITMAHPYNKDETTAMLNKITKKRMVCIPKGAQDVAKQD